MLTKVLEQKWVIRLFGLALIISPFLNILVSGEAVLDPGQHMTWPLFLEFVRGVPIPFKILELSSLAIGVLMLRGSVSAWRYLLALLGGYIVLQFIHLGHARTDKTAWFFIGINILVFFFIADQLVLKPRPLSVDGESADTKPSGLAAVAAQTSHEVTAPPALVVVPPVAKDLSEVSTVIAQIPMPPFVETAAPTTNVATFAPRTARKNIMIDLNGFGKFAKLIDISPEGLLVRCVQDAPEGISSRLLCITLGGVDLQLRYARQSKQDVFFQWENLSQHQVRSLNTWIRSISAA